MYRTSLVISKSCWWMYNFGTRNKIKFSTSNKIDLIPRGLSNIHFQKVSTSVASTHVLKHRVYASTVDVTGSRSEGPEVSGAVVAYVMIVVGIVGMAFGLNFGLTLGLKPNAPCYTIPVFAAFFVSSELYIKLMDGLSVLDHKHFSIGDIIEVGQLKGQVMEMGVITTSLLTAENRRKLVPTSWFYKQVIKNSSRGITIVPGDGVSTCYYDQ